MGTRLLLLYVICQTVITESLGGVTLPFPDLVGKVTPVKPKPLSAVSSLCTSSITKSSLTCDSKDIIPKLFSPVPGTPEFSLPLVITSSSRALPVPKIDSSSIADVKLPERLREKVSSSKLYNAPIRNSKLHTGTPDVSLPYKYPFLSSYTKLPNVLPTYSSWDLYYNSLNKIPSLSNIKSLPSVPVKPLKSIDTDVICPASKSNNVLAQPNITPLSISSTLDSPLILDSNIFSPLTSCSLPYPLYYKSMYLPGVQTPEMLPLSFRPTLYKAADNIDFLSQSCCRNLLNPKTLTSDTSLNSLPIKNGPYLSIYLNPIKTADIPKHINTIQLPKIPSNVPDSIKPVFSAQNAAAKNLSPPLEANSDSTSMVFESTFEPPEFLSFPVLKDCTDPKILRNSMPYLLADKIPNFKLKPCTPLKSMPSAFGSPSNFLNSPATSLVQIPSSPIVDVLSNRLNSFDCSKHTSDMLSIICAYVETIEKFKTNGSSSNCQSCGDSKDVPNLVQINDSSPFARKLSSYQPPLFTKECVTNPLKYSAPIIPLKPIISLESSAFSPITYFPSKIPQTPSSVSYINQSPFSSISQSTSNMVSSINDLVSNITQTILSSYKFYKDSAPQNIPQTPTIQANAYDNPEFIAKQTLPVLQLPQNNPVNTQSIKLPVIISSIDSINLPADDISTTLSSDASCKSSAFEVSLNQPLLIASSYPIATEPSTPTITFSSPHQLCPSYLLSPSLPSYPTIASPFYMEAPVLKVNSSKKDSDIEKFIELMLLTEILNNDESFDWDELDKLLEFLSVS